MVSKRKSVTFNQDVSVIYPKHFDGSSSPRPITTTPATATKSLTLDPYYLKWLRDATNAHYPFIVNRTFATHVYRQNFDEHIKIKTYADLHRARSREAAVPALAEKYGSLGWGTLHKEVNEKAWVKNYREIYRFDSSDEQLLEKIAEAFDQIKRSIAEKVNQHVQSPHDRSVFDHQLSTRQWEAFTQGGGALISPDFGPSGVNVTLDGVFDQEEPVHAASTGNQGGYGNVQASTGNQGGYGNASQEGYEQLSQAGYGNSNQGGYGHRMLFDMGMGSAGSGFGNAMGANAGTAASMPRAENWQSGLRYRNC